MYSYLYDSTVAFYAKKMTRSAYVHQYAITTLSVSAFLNIMTVLMLLAHLENRWARGALAHLSVPTELLVVVAILITLQIYSRQRRSARPKPGGLADRPGWVGGAYIIASFALVILAARWASHQGAESPNPSRGSLDQLRNP